MSAQEMNKVHALIVQFALAEGIKDLAQMMPPYWIGYVDQNWSVAISAAEETLRIQPPAHMRAEVMPGFAVVWFNGFLTGIVGEKVGSIVDSDQANEANLIKALNAAIDRVSKLGIGS